MATIKTRRVKSSRGGNDYLIENTSGSGPKYIQKGQQYDGGKITDVDFFPELDINGKKVQVPFRVGMEGEMIDVPSEPVIKRKVVAKEKMKDPGISIPSTQDVVRRAGPVAESLGMETTGKLSNTEAVAAPSEVASLDAINQTLKDNKEAAKNAGLIFAGTNLFIDVLNANSAYNAVSGQAKMNMFLAHQGAQDAIARGATKSNLASSRGYQEGENSLAYLAAQGLDINSAGAGRVQASQEAIGIYNGMLEEINASREALGFEQEIVQLNYDIAQAKIEKDYAIMGAYLNFGSSVGVSFL
jgi:hypothetical protein